MIYTVPDGLSDVSKNGSYVRFEVYEQYYLPGCDAVKPGISETRATCIFGAK
jgi:hypothetical protein